MCSALIASLSVVATSAVSPEQERVLAVLASLLRPAEQTAGSTMPVASAVDLTVMKLQAIATGGAARDFWDMHELLLIRGTSLASSLTELKARYPAADVGHVVRSLAYFGDALMNQARAFGVGTQGRGSAGDAREATRSGLVVTSRVVVEAMELTSDAVREAIV